MGIKGTVRRSTDGHVIHANIDTDIIIAEEPNDGIFPFGFSSCIPIRYICLMYLYYLSYDKRLSFSMARCMHSVDYFLENFFCAFFLLKMEFAVLSLLLPCYEYSNFVHHNVVLF